MKPKEKIELVSYINIIIYSVICLPTKMIPTIMPQINLDRILLNYLYPKNRTIYSPFYTDGNIKKNFAEM
jgi:hypothetical protein